MPGTVLGSGEYILPLWTVCVCVCVCLCVCKRQRKREKEIVKARFGGTSLNVVVFREREVWFGIQPCIQILTFPISSSVQPWACYITPLSPNFLISEMGIMLSRMVMRILTKGCL